MLLLVEQAAIGIDIGGTKMAVALVAADGAILRRTLLPTEAALGFDRAVRRMAEAIEELLLEQRGGKPLTGIGIGCAGPLDPQRGHINNPYTLAGWDRCDIVSPLQERFQVPVYLENDADAAAFGEVSNGAGRGFDPVVMLTFGTGIGGAAVVQGEIYRGAQGEHPELGHIVVLEDGPDCYCGMRGCLESLASGTAIAAAGSGAGFDSAPAVFAAAQAGHAAAQVVIQRAVRAAVRAAWTICHTFLPQRLVLGGGMMDAHFELFASAIQQQLASATQLTPQNVSVARATLGNDAGIVGAARLALARGQSRARRKAISASKRR